MPANRSALFQTALLRIMRPLARLMIAHGVTITSASELMKRALIAASERDVGPGATDSRVSLVTGLHRKDVKRLRTDPLPIARRSTTNACALLIAEWSHGADHIDPDGQPQAKTRAQFDELVRALRLDLPPATLLDALRDQGAITEDGHRISLVSDIYLASPDTEASLIAFEKNLAAHLDAATDNLLSPTDIAPHLERAAHFNQLSDASLALLETEARRAVMEMLQALNARALELQKSDDGKGTGRFSVGAYVLAQNEEDPEK